MPASDSRKERRTTGTLGRTDTTDPGDRAAWGQPRSYELTHQPGTGQAGVLLDELEDDPDAADELLPPEEEELDELDVEPPLSPLAEDSDLLEEESELDESEPLPDPESEDFSFDPFDEPDPVRLSLR